jgi:chromosome segregation ATPase
MGNCASKRVKASDIKALDEKYVAVEATLADTEDELERQKAREQEAFKATSQLWAQVNHLRAEREAFKRDVTEDLSQLQQNLHKEQHDLQRMTEDRDQIRSSLDDMKCRLKTTEDQERVTKEEANRLRSEISALASTKAEAAAEATKLLNEANGEVLQLKGNVMQLEVHNLKLTKQCELSRQTATTLENEKIITTKELATLKSRLSVAQQKSQSLSTELNSAKEELAAMYSSSRKKPGISLGQSFLEPVRFSESRDKDLRIEITEWQGETRIDIREWYGVRSRKVRP